MLPRGKRRRRIARLVPLASLPTVRSLIKVYPPGPAEHSATAEIQPLSEPDRLFREILPSSESYTSLSRDVRAQRSRINQFSSPTLATSRRARPNKLRPKSFSISTPDIQSKIIFIRIRCARCRRPRGGSPSETHNSQRPMPVEGNSSIWQD